MAQLTEFGEVMRRHRLQKNDMKLKEMARAIDRSPSYLSSVEHGQRPLSRQTALDCCEALGIEEGSEDYNIVMRNVNSAQNKFVIKTGGHPENKRQLAAGLVHKFDSLDDYSVDKIQQILDSFSGQSSSQESDQA